MSSAKDKFVKFKEIISRLRDPQKGCPWDLEQTHETLKPYLLEEAYEAIEAIDTDLDSLCGELGDLMLQIFLHAQIAEEEGRFDIEDVLDAITDKIVERHPHVFGDAKVSSAQEVKDRWEQIKKRGLDKGKSVFDRVPSSLPALQRAYRIGQKAAGLKFDWRDVPSVKEKIKEEVEEFLSSETADGDEEEYGDLLFALVQYGRKAGLNAEECLRKACRKFIQRFKYIEKKSGEKLGSIGIDTLEAWWEESKLAE